MDDCAPNASRWDLGSKAKSRGSFYRQVMSLFAEEGPRLIEFAMQDYLWCGPLWSKGKLPVGPCHKDLGTC